MTNPFGSDAATLEYAAQQAPLPALARELRRIAKTLRVPAPRQTCKLCPIAAATAEDTLCNYHLGALRQPDMMREALTAICDELDDGDLVGAAQIARNAGRAALAAPAAREERNEP